MLDETGPRACRPGRDDRFSPRGRAERSAAWFPPDFDDWPSTARWFFLSIVTLPSWHEALWAHAGDEYLKELRACRDERTIRRMRQLVFERGELVRERVLRGAPLPNGQRARRSHWIYRPGPMMRTRLEVSACMVGAPVAMPDGFRAPHSPPLARLAESSLSKNFFATSFGKLCPSNQESFASNPGQFSRRSISSIH